MYTQRPRYSKTERLTADQYAAVERLLSATPQSSASAGARLALVDGVSVAEAARRSSCTRQNIYHAIRRALDTVELAEVAAGLKPMQKDEKVEEIA